MVCVGVYVYLNKIWIDIHQSVLIIIYVSVVSTSDLIKFFLVFML